MATSAWGATIEDKTKKVLAFGSTIQSLTLTRTLNEPAEVECTLGIEGADTKALLNQLATGSVYLRLAENGTTRFFGVLTDLQFQVADDASVTARFADLAIQYGSVYGFSARGSLYVQPAYNTTHNAIVDTVLDTTDVLIKLVRSGSVTGTRLVDTSGMSRLEVLQQLAGLQNGIDWYVDPTGTTADATFLMASSLGSDKSASVRLQYGATGRANVQSATVQYLPPRNRVWTSYDNGLASLKQDTSSPSSQSKYGVYAVVLQRLERGTATEQDVFDQEVRTSWRRIVELSLEPAYAPRPWTDFNLGDTVAIDLTTSSLSLSTSQRINQIVISLDEQLVEADITVSSEVI